MREKGGIRVESRLIGKVVSRRFRVEDIIGRGGMAIVYRAFDLRSHQTVALKVLRENGMETAADTLLSLALDAGGRDNVTLILCARKEGGTWNRD